jgi:methylated-DNA-[protein]-cysteine S-methyltransferase
MRYKSMESPIGPLTIAGNESGLHSISFCAERRASVPTLRGRESGCDVVDETVQQLRAYFARKLVQFDLPLRPEGTSFQMDVWRELQNIPYGTVISYGELARRIGKPKASRAVGAANGANPIPIIIPCHRVIGSNGKMTGYAGGVHIKEALLALERVRLL